MATVTITRTAFGQYLATNDAGTQLAYGEGEGRFSSVELLLAALGGCAGIDVDQITSACSEPAAFEVTVTADKVSDAELGNHLENVQVTFRLAFPAGEDGDAAREALPAAAQKSHDRTCTVGRSLELPIGVDFRIG